MVETPGKECPFRIMYQDRVTLENLITTNPQQETVNTALFVTSRLICA
jgi:hypothetical protein